MQLFKKIYLQLVRLHSHFLLAEPKLLPLRSLAILGQNQNSYKLLDRSLGHTNNTHCINLCLLELSNSIN